MIQKDEHIGPADRVDWVLKEVLDLEFLNALLKLSVFLDSENLRMHLQSLQDGSVGKVKVTSP